MTAQKEELGIADEVLDKLLEGRDPKTIFESGGVLDALKKRLAERMLNAEMEHHLSEEEREAGNHRNGVYYGRQAMILSRRERIKQATLKRRKRMNRRARRDHVNDECAR